MTTSREFDETNEGHRVWAGAQLSAVWLSVSPLMLVGVQFGHRDRSSIRAQGWALASRNLELCLCSFDTHLGRTRDESQSKSYDSCPGPYWNVGLLDIRPYNAVRISTASSALAAVLSTSSTSPSAVEIPLIRLSYFDGDEIEISGAVTFAIA